MAQTDARAGFRLPWSSERSNIEQAETEQAQDGAAGGDAGWPTTDTAQTTDQHLEQAESTVQNAADSDWGTSATTTESSQEWGSAASAPAPGRTPSPKKPSKFLADLTRAMQAAAEESRNTTLSQFQADAKAHIEQIHERSAGEATTLRRQADDDVAAVREWSKAEIARIREETEAKISARKGRLDVEIEQHAAMIQREIEGVQVKVGGFEEEMARFFERLLAEDDPTHFATMAENLPEPPAFDEMRALDPIEFAAMLEYEAAIAEPAPDAMAEQVATDESAAADDETTAESLDPWRDAPAVTTDEVATDHVASQLAADEAEIETEAALDTETAADADVVSEAETDAESEVDARNSEWGAPEGGWDSNGTNPTGEMPDFPDGEVPEGFEIDREAAFAAIQAAAEAAASAEVATDAAARAEAVADIAIEIVGSHDEEDARVSSLGLTPDFESAEAEAAVGGDTGETVQEIGDDALAARLAGLVPGKGGKAASGDTKSTQVVVVGLVSVASIASFKRHLGRLSGVQSVGVSSGPDGEFLFAVNHGADVSLRDAIPGLPSFQARVTGSSDGVVNVTAHDPEADS
ncbi:MAG: hypothetical protein ACJ765_00180 [Chloroflexota bacterium]